MHILIFPSKIWAKTCALYTAKHGRCLVDMTYQWACAVLVVWHIPLWMGRSELILLSQCFLHSLWENRERHCSEDPGAALAVAGGHLQKGQWGAWRQPAPGGVVPGLQRCPGEWAHRGGGCPLRNWPGEGHHGEDSRPQGRPGKILPGWRPGWEDHPELAGERGLPHGNWVSGSANAQHRDSSDCVSPVTLTCQHPTQCLAHSRSPLFHIDTYKKGGI